MKIKDKLKQPCKNCGESPLLLKARDDLHNFDIICIKQHHNGFSGLLDDTQRKQTVQKTSKQKLKKEGLLFCWFCGRTPIDLHSMEKIEGDHIQQLRDDGDDEPENIMPLCSTCHKLKNWMTIHVVNKVMKKRGKKDECDTRTITK